MKKTANKQVICQVLMEAAKTDRNIVALCSDSRGSGSFGPFADAFPEQFVETGIAEQNLVSIAAGLARCGKKSYAVSPACFLSTRSYEQCKVDVAYSNTNVKLIGISGGVSYGALGMSHHSAQDGSDVAIVACGEMVEPAKRAAEILEQEGISALVLDMYCVKPLDEETLVQAAQRVKAVVTVEEHGPFGGLGSMVSQVIGRACPKTVFNLALSDAPVAAGTSREVFDYYGLNAEGIARSAKKALER